MYPFLVAPCMGQTATTGDDLRELYESLEPGDEFVFNDRSLPLRVANRGRTGAGLAVWGPRGGHYVIRMKQGRGYGLVHRLDRDAADGYSFIDHLKSLEIVQRFEDQSYEWVEPSDLDGGESVRFDQNTDEYTVEGVQQHGSEWELALDSPAGPHSDTPGSKLVYADDEPHEERYRLGQFSTAATMLQRVE